MTARSQVSPSTRTPEHSPLFQAVRLPPEPTRANNISVYTIDPNSGTLAAIAGSPFAAGAGPSLVDIEPTGYTANEPSADISAYAIDGTTGVLTAIPGGPFTAGIDPFTVSISPEAPGIRD